jgi:hypothetical protein
LLIWARGRSLCDTMETPHNIIQPPTSWSSE